MGTRITAPLCFSWMVAACSGSIGPSGGGSGDEPDGAPAAGAPNPTPRPAKPPESPRTRPAITGAVPGRCAVEPGPQPLRRLTNHEYDSTIRDLFGPEMARTSAGFPGDERHHGLDNNAEDGRQNVLRPRAEAYAAASRAIAARAVSRLATLLPCDVAGRGEAACLEQLVTGFGRRAFRRPLDDGERQRFLAFARTAAREHGFETAVRLTVQGFLQSPQFLYRIEGACAAGLGPYDIASRLSYLLWGTMPDGELLAAAETGRLATADEVGLQARRLMASPRAAPALRRLYELWLALPDFEQVEADEKLFAGFATARPLMREEALRFLDQVVATDAGDFRQLLSAPFTFLNRRLAAFYGVGGSPAGDALEKVTLDAGRRAGALTLGAHLTLRSLETESDPIRRGTFVREQVLCEVLPPPPDDVPPLPPPRAGQSTRQRLEEHRRAPACQGCHALIDPIGLAFEHYDAVGRWRSTQAGVAIDVRGEIAAHENPDAAGRFTGAGELGRLLAAAPAARRCAATHWLRWALGRDETGVDACTLASLAEVLDRESGSVRKMLLALVTSPAFLARRAGGQSP